MNGIPDKFWRFLVLGFWITRFQLNNWPFKWNILITEFFFYFFSDVRGCNHWAQCVVLALQASICCASSLSQLSVLHLRASSRRHRRSHVRNNRLLWREARKFLNNLNCEFCNWVVSITNDIFHIKSVRNLIRVENFNA